MRIALITSWNEQCGIAEYARNLIQNTPDADYEIINRFQTYQNQKTKIDQCDLFVLNYEPGILGHWTKEIVSQISTPKILILHTSNANNNLNEFTDSFDKVVVHEDAWETRHTYKFVYIPMGIPDFRFASIVRYYKEIGTFGIPFPKKGFHQVCQAAQILGKTACVTAPATRHFDTEIMKRVCLEANPFCNYQTNWMPQEDVITILSFHEVNVFAYNGNDLGISAAVRLGLAAQRPIVLTRDRQFRDLFAYEDEITFVDSNDPQVLAEGISQAIAKGIVPKRVVEDMSWKKVGEKYLTLYKSLI